MPPIRFSTLKHCALLAISISFNKEIISPCSYYVKKGLVYIIFAIFSKCQISSCLEYTKAKTCCLYNIRLVLVNKYYYRTTL